MTVSFAGKIAIVTGAGGGLGREYALELARRGAKVVVNDLGGARDGTGHSDSALKVVEEIKAMGGEAVSNGDSCSSWEGAQRMVNTAIETFGDLHVVVNNAGILRDRVLVNMTEEECLGNDARAELWPHPHDGIFNRALRQFRPDQLWRGQAGARGIHQVALPRRREI